jgi:hypothetical protein
VSAPRSAWAAERSLKALSRTVISSRFTILIPDLGKRMRWIDIKETLVLA